MEVFFLRHGQTEWNRLRRIQGSTEWTDLSDDGVHDAEMARDGLLARGLSFDRLYSSPYRRAFHTAQIIGEGLGIEPVIDPRLREMSFGPYEGTSYDNDDWTTMSAPVSRSRSATLPRMEPSRLTTLPSA